MKPYLLLSTENKVEEGKVFHSVQEFDTLANAVVAALKLGVTDFRVAKVIDWEVNEV